MNTTECISKLAAYYKQPMYDSIFDGEGNSRQMPNLIIAEAFRWIDENVKNQDFFYKKVLKNFKPSSTVPFPVIADFEEINKRFDPWIPEPHRIGPDPKFDEAKAAQNFIENHGIPAGIPAEFQHITIDKLLIDDRILKPGEMLKKYGYVLCQRVWQHIGAHDLRDYFPDILHNKHIRKTESQNPEYFHD